MTTPLLVADQLVRTYRDPVTRRPVTAVDGISFEVPEGSALAILGASGAGKSSLTRLLLGLERPDRGKVEIGGVTLEGATARQLRGIRRRMQAVFQDPRSSLNPSLRVATIIAEPLLAQGCSNRKERARRVAEALDMVGLPVTFGDRRPEQLSGGERQRVAIARAIAPGPDLLVLDEPVSSLDGPVRGQILNLLGTLKAKLGLAIIMVSHDIRSISNLCSTVMVMYAGRCVEAGPTAAVLENPLHPYTQTLLAAVPRSKVDFSSIPDPTMPSETGCSCRTWCPLAETTCKDRPELEIRANNHRVACWVQDRSQVL